MITGGSYKHTENIEWFVEQMPNRAQNPYEFNKRPDRARNSIVPFSLKDPEPGRWEISSPKMMKLRKNND